MKKENDKGKNLIRLSKSVLDKEEEHAVLKVLKKGYLGMGKKVQEFENNLSVMMKRPVVCVSSGTSALHLALQACGIGKGDEVLVQSITYIASFQAISSCGAKPKACDINLDSLTINLNDAKKRITSKTKAIMPVHYAGDPGEIEKVYEFASFYNLRVIEDAAHAFGSIKNGKFIGSFGDIVCFSFDGIKNITSGEGGCIVTSDQEITDKVKDARLLGVMQDSESRFEGKRKWDFDVLEQGWRYHMSDLMAGIGISQLTKLPYFSKKRQSLAKYYDTRLREVKEIKFFYRNYNSIVPHIYPILIPSYSDRNFFQIFMNKHNIQTGIHYKPNHLLQYYREDNLVPLRNTEAIYKNLITLPLHPDLSNDDIDYIVSTIKKFSFQ